MNIIIINHYAGSPRLGMAYRPYYLAREWMKEGHDVTILSADKSHIRSENPEIKNNFEIIYEDTVRYCWVKTPNYSGNNVRRIINMFSFVLKLRLNIKRISKLFKPDIVIASSTYPLDNYVASKLAKKNNAQHIFEVHDLWPLSPMELGGYSKFHPFILVMQAAENFAYKHAHKIVSMLPKTLEHMVEHGMNKNKWNYIPNGITIKEWLDKEELNDQTKNEILSIKKKYTKIVAYTGTVGLANALDSLILSANKIEELSAAIVIVGKGPEKNTLQKLVSDERIENVFFIEPIPKQQIPSLLEYFDYLYIGLQYQSLFRFGISPNKLIDYLMAGKPIIQAIKAGNDIVNEADAGISIEPENPIEIANAVKELSNFSEERLSEISDNAKKYVLKNHDYASLANKFLEIMNS